MALIVILFCCGLSAALVGRAKGGSAILWFAIGFCLPILGTIAAALHRSERDEPRRRCEGCGRILPISDQVCMGCGRDLDMPDEVLAPAASQGR